jgi:hypothetical protein
MPHLPGRCSSQDDCHVVRVGRRENAHLGWREAEKRRHALQHIARHYNTLLHIATRSNTLLDKVEEEAKQSERECAIVRARDNKRQTMRMTRCNPLQHTENALKTLWKHIVTLCNTLQHTAKHCNTLQNTATHCICAYSPAVLIYICATHCITLQHTYTLTVIYMRMQHSRIHSQHFPSKGRGGGARELQREWK